MTPLMTRASRWRWTYTLLITGGIASWLGFIDLWLLAVLCVPLVWAEEGW